DHRSTAIERTSPTADLLNGPSNGRVGARGVELRPSAAQADLAALGTTSYFGESVTTPFVESILTVKRSRKSRPSRPSPAPETSYEATCIRPTRASPISSESMRT